MVVLIIGYAYHIISSNPTVFGQGLYSKIKAYVMFDSMSLVIQPLDL